MEGGGRGLVWGTVQALDCKEWGKLRKNSFMTTGLKAEIWNPALPRTKQENNLLDRDVYLTCCNVIINLDIILVTFLSAYLHERYKSILITVSLSFTKRMSMMNT